MVQVIVFSKGSARQQLFCSQEVSLFQPDTTDPPAAAMITSSICSDIFLFLFFGPSTVVLALCEIAKQFPSWLSWFPEPVAFSCARVVSGGCCMMQLKAFFNIPS